MAFFSRPASRPARLGRLRLSEYGWGRRLALIGAALVGSAAFAYAANLASRHALWQVVRACAFDQKTLGSPAPCLEANLGDGETRGYVVLRPPIGPPDTILSPTRPLPGLEAPELQEPGAPNYFALAWEARRWLDPKAPDDRAALAVNSRLARSQDQLHVHIGCLNAGFAASLQASGLGPVARAWRRGPDLGRRLEFWTYRSGAKDWAGLEPFRLLKQLVGEASLMQRTTLAAVQVKDEFVIVALVSRPGGWYAAAEDVIDARC